ncbi:MAG: helix-turn-helix domain-containing protein [Candidatus Izemoplasmatales bacterium]
MKRRTVYIYQKDNNQETLVSFLGGYSGFEITIIDRYLKLTESDPLAATDWNHLREKCLEELVTDICLFVVPITPNFVLEPILKVMPMIGFGVYTIESIIPKIVLEGIHDVRNGLRNYYYNTFGAEIIQTVQGFIKANLNQSVAAKQLYLHRNTLNYRIDHFIAYSEINVKSFFGAYAFYLLFNT